MDDFVSVPVIYFINAVTDMKRKNIIFLMCSDEFLCMYMRLLLMFGMTDFILVYFIASFYLSWIFTQFADVSWCKELIDVCLFLLNFINFILFLFLNI